MAENTTKNVQIIKDQTLEHIAVCFGGWGSGERIISLLQNWGVSDSLIEYPNTKWRMVFSILQHYSKSSDKKDHELLFKIICEIIHPLMWDGDKKKTNEIAEDFNNYLDYDGLMILYSDFDKKYKISRQKDLVEIDADEEAWNQMNIDLFEQEQEELVFLREAKNKEKISTLRKAYQVFMNIVEVYCESPSRPTHELNSAYINTKKLISNAVDSLYLHPHVLIEDGTHNPYSRVHTLQHYFIPFTNLFTAEAEYKDRILHWDELRPKMHASYGSIDDLYQKVDGSDVLSTPDVQQTLNDVSLLLSKTKEENKKRIDIEKKEVALQTPVQRIEITAMPELNVKSIEENIIRKGKKKIHLPKFKSTDWSKISIRFLDKRNVLITANKKDVVHADYEILGFADTKSDKPNMAWAFFFGLAQNNGETKSLPTPIPDTIKQQKKQLSERLKDVFKNDTDPFYDSTNTHIYKIKITLIPPVEQEKKDGFGVEEYLEETMVSQDE